MMFQRLMLWTRSLAKSRHAEAAMGTVSFVESSVFPIPVEVMFLPMCLARPERAMRYALIASVTSVAGGVLGWLIGFYFFDLIAHPILQFYGKVEAFDQLKLATGDGTILLMLLTSGAAHLPPMKVVTILSGVVGFNLPLFILSAIVARGGKFFLLAWVVRAYGPALANVIQQRLATVALIAIVAGGVVWAALHFL
jgi:membrane protein YqaA with SNARE-associated domain